MFMEDDIMQGAEVEGGNILDFLNNLFHLGQSIQEWSKLCGRQPLKNLLSPLFNTLSHSLN